jgi:MFS family permease
MTAWTRDITPRQWKALIAAMLGWMLDGMDIMLYAFALTAIRQEFGLSKAAAGVLASVTLVASAFGGTLFGVLADRIGRARSLVWAILAYSIFTALLSTSRGLYELVIWRTLVGLGLGGEWSAGSVLVSETWPAAHRGKAIGLMQSGWAIGYILAAIISGIVLPRWGWRWLFAAGIAPALVTLWIRRNVEEPELWTAHTRAQPRLRHLFARGLAGRTVVCMLLTSTVLFAYWGVFTWIPTFLSAPVDQGGAGLGIVRSSAWVIPMQIGAFFGYTTFGFGADRFGRRPMLTGFLVAAAILVPIYSLWARSNFVLLVVGPLVGFFGHGYFSAFGAMLSELFPTRIRATAQGFVYNAGRAVSALAPYSIGALADRAGFGVALTATAAFFLLGAGLVKALPETVGRALAEDAA